MKRVVFVDDEALVLEALRDRLRAHRKRWDMHFVQDAQAALDALADARTDVVVTDVRMPKGGGIELLKQIRQEHPHVVRIVLSGDTGLKNAFAAVPVAHQWLTKPCSGDLLETTIERTCGLYDLLHNESLQEIVGGADTLPSLPKVYAELARTLADPRACAKHVAAVVEKDMAMCAKVLQLANSSFFGPKQRIVSLEGAVSYLGTTMIRSLILCAEVFRVFEAAKVDARSLEHLQAHALKTAQLAARLTTTHNGVEHFFAAGVLHDVGKLVVASLMPERLRRAALAAQGGKQGMLAAETASMGVTHAEIGAYLLGLWGLPLPVVEAVAYHHRPSRVPHTGFAAVDAVHVADALVAELEPGPEDGFGDEAELDLDHLFKLGVGQDRLEAWRALAERCVGGLATGPAARRTRR
ncbi:MAG: response regulator [Proteobacteria bacterium]|nr:response regulator [Pseudomonadota bacterium]